MAKNFMLVLTVLAASVFPPAVLGSATCKTKPLEVVFAVDLSSSLTLHGYNNLKLFLQGIADHLPIAEDQTRPAVIGFATEVNLEVDLGEAKTAKSFVEAIERITYYRGLTATGLAMQLARHTVFPKSRPEASKLLVVVTDGIANLPNSMAEARALVRSESAELIRQGVRIHAVGVGDNHLREELVAIAGSDDFSMTDNYESLKALVKSLAKNICEGPRPKCKLLEPAPSHMNGYSAHVNECFEFFVTGVNSGTVWGTNIYTADSSIPRAAIHAGVLKQGETKLVRVRVLPGQETYLSSSRNGIASVAFGRFGLSYEFLDAPGEEESQTGCKKVEPTPESLSSYTASHVNECLEFVITGRSNGGSVWGSSIYTSDSALRRAAIHAGVVKPDETKRVRVRVLPGQLIYKSTNRNGVLSNSYGSYRLSYEFLDEVPEEVKPGCATASKVEPPPIHLLSYASRVNECFEFRVTGANSGGGLWGAGIYTADSALSRAAVHAGVVKLGETKLVRVRVLPGQSAYQSSNQNGVVSNAYGVYALSYEFTGWSSEVEQPECKQVNPAPSHLNGYSADVNKCVELRVTGDARSGQIWGSGVYTADSTLAKAAVHAGVLKQGEAKLIRVRVLPGRDRYDSANQNGIVSVAYGQFALSYEFVKQAR